MMQGFGVHTFRLVNDAGEGVFVKFHWKPLLGVHSLLWDECQQIAGKDPDFNRRDLWDAIESGQFPEWELGVQLVPESDEFKFPFDLLDSTKIIPEEQVPVQPVGRMVLDRNPDNFFAETEQVAFHTANVVPGIDFTNDPLLQFRNFSYLDTQLIRLGGQTSHNCPSTDRSPRYTTTSETASRSMTSHKASPAISRTPSAAAVRPWHMKMSSATTPNEWTDIRSASAPRASRISTASRGCSGTVCPPSRRSTSFRHSRSNWAR